MFYYIVDKSTTKSHPKLERLIISWLKQRRLDGVFNEVHSPQQISEQAKTGCLKKYKTIVAIGDDQTLQYTINGVVASGITSAVGFIPTTSTSISARKLQLKNWHQAAGHLSGRRLAEFSLGRRPNGYIFIQETISTKNNESNLAKLCIDDNLQIETPMNQMIVHYNGQSSLDAEPSFLIEIYANNPHSTFHKISNKSILANIKNIKPTDQAPDQTLQVRLPANHIELLHSDQQLYTSGGEKIDEKATITTTKKTIQIITGKHLAL